jgi:hypothetical protein
MCSQFFFLRGGIFPFLVPYKNDIKIKIDYTHMHLLSIEWNILVGGQGCSGGYGEGGAV